MPNIFNPAEADWQVQSQEDIKILFNPLLRIVKKVLRKFKKINNYPPTLKISADKLDLCFNNLSRLSG